MRLVEQHDVVHPRLELALGDLRADVLGLVGRLLLEDAQLRVLGLLRDLLLGDVQDARRRGDVHRDLAGEGLEVLVAGHEVGVAVDLDQHADLAVGVDVGGDGALGGLAAAHLQRLVAEAHAQQLDGLVEVAVGLLQRRLAVHHARARPVAELLDVLGCDGCAHLESSSFFSSVLSSSPTASATASAAPAAALATPLSGPGTRSATAPAAAPAPLAASSAASCAVSTTCSTTPSPPSSPSAGGASASA